MASVLNVEWLNRNSQRAYPFQEDMRRRPIIDGSPMNDYAIPNGLLLDFIMATNLDPQPQAYVSTMTFAGSAVTLVISNVEDGTVLATVSTAFTGDEDWIPVNFSGSGRHDDIRGTAVFGNLAKVAESYPDGIYSFTSDETMFEARCCRPSVPCVSGIYLSDATGSQSGTRLRGDVALVAGQNIRLDYDESRNAIIINADNRYGFNDKCECETADHRQPVLTVNGISTPAVEIEGGDCVKVEKKEGRILISDTCSKPCCGCAELTFLNQKTNNITTSIDKLDQFSQLLHDRLEDFIRNVLLSDISVTQYL